MSIYRWHTCQVPVLPTHLYLWHSHSIPQNYVKQISDSSLKYQQRAFVCLIFVAHLFKREREREREQNWELSDSISIVIRIVIRLVGVLQFLKHRSNHQPQFHQLITKFSLFILTITILLLWGNIFHLLLKQKTLFFGFTFLWFFVNSFCFCFVLFYFLYDLKVVNLGFWVFFVILIARKSYQDRLKSSAKFTIINYIYIYQLSIFYTMMDYIELYGRQPD